MTRPWIPLGASVAVALQLCLLTSALEVRAEQQFEEAQPQQDKPDEKQAKYSVEVMVVHATRVKDKKPAQKPVIDERIGDLPQLREEPFSLYDRFDWLTEKTLPLKKGDPQRLELPNQRVLRLALIEELAQKVRFSASINRPGGQDFLPLLSVKAQPGKVFIVAGQKYKNGILVLVLRVTKSDAGN
jgi:hypothetical protein